MSEYQNWQEQLQQKVGELLARRIGSFAEDLQQVQSVLNDLCQRMPTVSAAVTAEEAAGLQQHAEQLRSTATQEAESGWQARLEQVTQQTRTEYEAQIQSLQAQLEEARQSGSGVLEMAAAGTAGFALAGNAPAPNYDAFKTAVEEIDAQRQQADVLAALVRHASQFATRVVFFVIKSGNAIGWKATGFANGLSDETVRALNIPVPSNALLNDAVISLRTSAALDSAGVLGPYSAGEVARAVAVPLVIRGKAAAILYADSGTDNGGLQRSALEALMQVTSMSIELLPARRTQPVAVAPAPQPVAAPPAPEPAPQPVAVTAPAPTVEIQPQVEEASNIPAPIVAPMPSIPALPVVEAPVEVKEAAWAETTQAAQPVAATPAPSPQNDDEVRAHNDARRFARLLVSEIKLYNEQKVSEGRKANDLYERLKEDIDRSRQMYEKRVSSAVSAKYDYFYDELLHTLAEGDTAKLGRGCPGPTVPVS